jgi:hypothetical protein
MRYDTSWDDALATPAAFGLLLLLAFAMNWVGVFVGLSVRAPEVVNTIGTLILFPLMFLSNTFVPTQGMAPGCERWRSGIR